MTLKQGFSPARAPSDIQNICYVVMEFSLILWHSRFDIKNIPKVLNLYSLDFFRKKYSLDLAERWCALVVKLLHNGDKYSSISPVACILSLCLEPVTSLYGCIYAVSRSVIWSNYLVSSCRPDLS
jgi:hypothetical protein